MFERKIIFKAKKYIRFSNQKYVIEKVPGMKNRAASEDKFVKNHDKGFNLPSCMQFY